MPPRSPAALPSKFVLALLETLVERRARDTEDGSGFVLRALQGSQSLELLKVDPSSGTGHGDPAAISLDPLRGDLRIGAAV